MTVVFTKADIETLLGRTVTDVEAATIQRYITTATRGAEKILGFPIVVQKNAVAAAKTFLKRTNRSTIFTPPFTVDDDTTVVLDGTTLTDEQYETMWFDDFNADVKNSVVLNDCERWLENPYIDKKMVVTTKWGFQTMPDDLKTAIFQWAMDVANSTDNKVQSENVGSYSVTYRANNGIVGQPYLAVIQSYSSKVV